jgi:hypothetical protein
MISPAIRPSRKGTTFANGTVKLPPPAGTAQPLALAGAAQRAPDRDRVVTESDAFVLGREIGKRTEELHLVGGSHCFFALATKSQRDRLEKTLFSERLQNGVARAASASRCASKSRNISDRFTDLPFR